MILISQKYRAVRGGTLNTSVVPERNLQNWLAGLPRRRQQLPVMGKPDYRWINLIARATETFGIDPHDRARWALRGDASTPGGVESWLLTGLGVDADARFTVHLSAADRDVNAAIDAFILDILRSDPQVISGTVEPETKLARLFSAADRHNQWQSLSAALNWPLPQLQPDVSWWFWPPTVLLLAPYIVGWGLLARECDQMGGLAGAALGLTVVLLGFAGMAVIVMIPLAIVKRFAHRLPVKFPEHISCVRDLRETISPERRREFSDSLRRPMTGTVWEIVRQIVSEEYEWPLESVTRATPLQ
jgi:hypothetical protein